MDTFSGTMKNWINGEAFSGLSVSENNNGTMKYWLNGVPMRAIFQPTSTYQPRYGFVNHQNPGIL